MLKDAVAVIDCGSSKITGLIGSNGINNNYSIMAYAEEPCFELINGTFDNPVGFRHVLSKVFSAITTTARAKVTEVYVSVPSDFLLVKNANSQIYFNRKRRLRQKDVDEFLAQTINSIGYMNYQLVDYSGVQYFLDGQKKVTRLIGETTASISGLTSFYFAKSQFIEEVTKVLKGKMKVKTIHFVPVPLAESLLLFPERDRFAFEVLVDVGTSVTGFSILYGGGVLYSTSFAMGGGYINAYLMQEFDFRSYELSEKLKRKLNLTLKTENNGVYEIVQNDKMYRFPQSTCNQLCKKFIAELAEKIDLAIKASNVRLPMDFKISLTGGGLAYIRGAVELLFSCIEIPINVVCPKIGYMRKPEETSKMAMLNYALNGKK